MKIDSVKLIECICKQIVHICIFRLNGFDAYISESRISIPNPQKWASVFISNSDFIMLDKIDIFYVDTILH